MSIALRGNISADSLRRAVAELDSDLVLFQPESARVAVERNLAEPNLIGRMLAGFAVLGLFLAALGLYGVIAGFVTERTNEIGVRMALGAHLRDVLWLVLGKGLQLTTVGVAIGMIGAVAVKDFQGPVSVTTNGGGINLDGIAGPIDGATGGGSISASVASVANEIKLLTAGGGVTLRAPENAAFDLDASTSAGTVTSDLPVPAQGKPSRQRLKGAVNGGGKQVSLRTGGGNVTIKRL